MQQRSAAHAIPCQLAKIAFFTGVIAISRLSDILPDRLATGPQDDIVRQTTDLLLSISSGDRNAIDRLMPLVYDELRAIAANRLVQYIALNRSSASFEATGDRLPGRHPSRRAAS